MKDDATATGAQDLDVAVINLSVVLIADNVDPSMINPDFLRHNGIVDPGLQTGQPPVSTPVFSQVILERGLSVVARPDRFEFAQQGQALAEDAESPDIARRFIENIPYPPYKAIGINLTGARLLDRGSENGAADALAERGGWMAFGDVSPAVSLKAAYHCEGRQITLDVHDAKRRMSDGSESPGLVFAANFHRDVSEMNRERRIAKLMSVLSAWKGDLSDFKNLVAKFSPGRYAS